MGTTKILIVEDEPNMVAGLRDNSSLKAFRSPLRWMEWRVWSAPSGIPGLGRSRCHDAAHERAGCL